MDRHLNQIRRPQLVYKLTGIHLHLWWERRENIRPDFVTRSLQRMMAVRFNGRLASLVIDAINMAIIHSLSIQIGRGVKFITRDVVNRES